VPRRAPLREISASRLLNNKLLEAVKERMYARVLTGESGAKIAKNEHILHNIVNYAL
jgi:hypothetical protein